MRLEIVAVGRLKGTPEAALVADYLARAGQTGRNLGLGPALATEVDERKYADSAAQSARLVALSDGAYRVALDQRGLPVTSEAFANRLAQLRDGGTRRATFLIGGAEGHTEALTSVADLLLSFGQMVWPHALARVMLAEQIYRATTILAGLPYHRA